MDSVISTDINTDTIEDGHYVIIKKTFEDSYRLVRVRNNERCYFGKQRVMVGSLIGAEYGTKFELMKDAKLQQIKEEDTVLNIDRDTQTHRDNRELIDDNVSQKLSRDDIENLKKEKTTSHNLIKTLVENSTTFEGKNKHTQDKYLAKKQVKYLNYFTLIRPTTRSLMEMYHSTAPSKNSHLRIDILSKMLHFCNVMSGGQYIVVDTNLGITSAACFERMGGKGSIIQLIEGEQINPTMRTAVSALNFPYEVMHSAVTTMTVFDLVDPNVDEPVREADPNAEKKQKRKEEVKKAREMLAQNEMDALLVIVDEYDPQSFLKILFPYLGMSRPFAIFCSTIDPLIKIYKATENAAFMRISETWMREYQVMQDRTRPNMLMDGASGFLLTGYKVE